PLPTVGAAPALPLWPRDPALTATASATRIETTIRDPKACRSYSGTLMPATSLQLPPAASADGHVHPLDDLAAGHEVHPPRALLDRAADPGLDRRAVALRARTEQMAMRVIPVGLDRRRRRLGGEHEGRPGLRRASGNTLHVGARLRRAQPGALHDALRRPVHR